MSEKGAIAAEKEEDYEFEDFQKGSEFGFGKIIYLFVMSALVCCLPSYIYITVYELDLQEFYLMYAGVGLFCSVMLAWAGKNVAKAEATLLHQSVHGRDAWTVQPKDVGFDKLEDMEKHLIGRETLFYALWTSNVKFLFPFFFFAFYALRTMTLPYNFVISMSLASTLVFASTMQN